MIVTHPITYYVVRCDECGTQNRSVADGFHSDTAAEEDAIRAGWEIGDSPYGWHLCQRCVEERPLLLDLLQSRLDCHD